MLEEKRSTQFSRRAFLHTCCLSLASCVSVPGVEAEAKKKPHRKNVLFIVTDDQGAHLGCLGTRGIRTPHADALAGRGVLFRNAFATCSSCSPARSSILTGMVPHSNGHWRNTHTPQVPGNDEDYSRRSRFGKIEKVGVHERIPTLVELLNSAGYVTGITEKFHLSPVWKYPFHHRFGAGSQPATHAKAMRAFLSRCGDRPFFLMANIGNTHRPFKPHIVSIDEPPVDPGRIDVPGSLPDTPLLREDLAEYLTAVQCADACAGALLDELRVSGRLKDTLIVFTGDQGWCYHRAKATAYDAGIRVPLIISGPGVGRALEREELVSHIDFVPTVLSLLEIPIPETVQGKSLWPLLRGGKTSAWRDFVFAEHNAHGPNPLEFYPIRSVFDGRYHYLRNLRHEVCWEGEPESLLSKKVMPAEIGFAGPQDAFQKFRWGNRSFEATCRAKKKFPLQYRLLKNVFKRPPEELYDLKTDPFETWNIVDEPRMRQKLGQLRSVLDSWMEETGDPGVDVRSVRR